MTYRDAALKYKIPWKALKRMQTAGVIGYPLTDADLEFIRRYALLWANNELIRLQLSRRSKTERSRIYDHPELTKPERYVLSRYRNNRGGKIIHAKQLRDEVMHYYGVPEVIAVQAVKKIRRLAYREKSKKR